MNDDRRLIEDYLPIQAISAEASREKSVRKGHISTLHLWWARRPLVACRAAVYGALVPAERFRPKNGPEEKRDSLMRANAAKFVERLCKYPGNTSVIKEAQRHILEAHAERLTRETGKKVTVEDIEEGRAPLPAPRLGKFFVYVIKCSDESFYIGHTDDIQRRFEEHCRGKVGWTSSRMPLEIIHYEEFDSREDAIKRESELKTGFGRKWLKKEYAAGRLAARQAGRPKVLDMFAGGGAIPLEALRLGCEAYALDLNPVAHIIELCTLVYPQKYGKPDPKARGMVGQPARLSSEDSQAGSLSHNTWGGLAEEVRYWGNWVLKKVKAEIGDLYPPLPDLEWWEHVGQAASLTGTSLATQSLMFPSVKQDVAKTKRKLPHWEKEGACYFVTYRTKDGIVLPENARDVVLENWKHWSSQRYDLWQVVIMPDHVHVLLSPLPKDDGSFWTLTEILHTAKSYTANQINKIMGRTGPLWQDERFDHIVRNPASFEAKWHYIRQNACKAGLAARPTDYPWLYEHDGLAARPTLTPVAYLWTRTVRCKNPSCGATVPLVRQTWLCKKGGSGSLPDKKGRYIALRMVVASSPGQPGWQPGPHNKVRFEVVEATTEKGLGFDPSIGSKGGNATCPFCGTVADSGYVKVEGCAKRMGQQMMAIVCTRPGQKGKTYLSADGFPDFIPDDDAIRKRIDDLCRHTGLTVPNEPIVTDAKNSCWTHLYGLNTFGDLFTPRQMLCLLTFAAAVREVVGQCGTLSGDPELAKAVTTFLAMAFDKIADISTSLSAWEPVAQCTRHLFGRQAIPMVWDFGESVPVGTSAGNWNEHLGRVLDSIGLTINSGYYANVKRGSATALPWPDAYLDAVITDPPYYDNVPYANISDFFYVWLKRTIGHLYPEHFATGETPKKKEAVADAVRHGGDKEKARHAYEQMMAQAFSEANRVLKPGGQLTVVYAHKTTLGWSTLVDALRQAGFTVTEAWPLDTENKSRLRAMESAALASSIFLVARKREGTETGSYEEDVRPELEQIVRERVDTLWKMGITGADLVIAAVGAGLRAFTRFARVEYANGEEVPAEKFLAEVEGVVLETLLEKIFVGQAASLSSTGQRPVPLGSVDGPTRFYVLWRYTYKAAEMDAGEAIVFTYGQGVELDGPNGLTVGRAASPALVEKRKGKYRLRDFTERGNYEKLGLPDESQAGWQPAPLIDALHRILWLIENEPRNLNRFLDEARPDRERLRLVAQALAGTALAGRRDEGADHLVTTTASEQAALRKLVANWRTLIDQRLAASEGTLFGQRKLL